MAFGRFTIRTGTLAQWTALNPILEQGEQAHITPDSPGGESGYKIGDGVTAFNNLPLIAADGGSGGLDTEAVQDAVAAMLTAGTGVTLSYDDGAGTLTITATAGGGTTDPEIVRDVIGAALVAGPGLSITVDDAGDTITIGSTVSATDIGVVGTGKVLIAQDFTTAGTARCTSSTNVAVRWRGPVEPVNMLNGDEWWDTTEGGGLDAEAVQDTVAAMLVEGTGIDLAYNDTAGTLTITSTATGGVTDHGALAGLADDDHTQYALADGSRGAFAASSHSHDYAATGHTHSGYVPTSRTVNSKALSANITLNASDVGAASSSHTHTPEVTTLYYNGTSWIDADGGTVTSTRPTAKRVLAFGGTTQPTFLVAGDVWVKDNA